MKKLSIIVELEQNPTGALQSAIVEVSRKKIIVNQ
jgi:hypothetical protein